METVWLATAEPPLLLNVTVAVSTTSVTLMVNDFYLKGGEDGTPLGNIQLLGKISGPILASDTALPRPLATWIADRSIDLGGRWVGPAFIDAHLHITLGAATLAQCSLAGCTSRDEFEGRLRAHRAKLDDNAELMKFATKMEEVVIATVEDGYMTKDLALLVGDEQSWLSTEGFLKKVAANLEAAMAE
jgi:hypothetical protein